MEDTEQIDVLINNAGIISAQNKRMTNDNFEETFQVNYLSHFLLTTLLLDKLKESAHARIINLVCEFQSGKIDFTDLQCNETAFSNMRSYYNSKLALLYFTHELSNVLKGSSVTSYAVNPGLCETNLWRNIFPYNYSITWFFMSPWGYLFCRTPSNGAETTYYCSIDRDIEEDSGKYYKNCEEVNIGQFNDRKTRKLWEMSDRMTKPFLDHSFLSTTATETRAPHVTFDDGI